MELVLMRIGISCLLALSGVAVLGCSSHAPVQRELIIAPAPVACDGDPPGTCLSASEPNGDQWTMRFDEIDGFAYEPGFTYQVLVEEPPVSDELSVVPRLRLVRVLSQEPVAEAAGDLLAGEWLLENITPGDAAAAAWSASKISATFHPGDGWVEGFSGCNHYLAALSVQGQTIGISAPETTPEVCAKSVEELERIFLQALAKAKAFTLAGERLALTLSDGAVMRFRSAGG
jgi:heat shock protein HslJ